jgi:hypothetical protein
VLSPSAGFDKGRDLLIFTVLDIVSWFLALIHGHGDTLPVQ